MIGVPKDLAAVDSGWLEAALRAAGFEVGVVSVAVEQIAVGAGYIGLLARLTPTYNGGDANGAPASMIVKLPSPEPGPQMLGMMLRLWEREGRFYREVAPNLTVRTPRCFLSEQDPADSRVVLLLEDLGHLAQPDQLLGTTRARAERAIDWLASFHASTWGIADDPGYLAWIPRPDDPIYTGVEPLLHGSLPAFKTTFADIMTPTRERMIDRAVADFSVYLGRRDSPFVVGHGDFRLDNMLFDGEDNLAVLDWQLVLVGGGGYDLAYFIVESLTTEQRREWERPFLERYLAKVTETVDPGITFDELLDGYRMVIHFLMSLMPATQLLDFDVNDRSRALARAIVGRVLAAAEDHPLS